MATTISEILSRRINRTQRRNLLRGVISRMESSEIESLSTHGGIVSEVAKSILRQRSLTPEMIRESQERYQAEQRLQEQRAAEEQAAIVFGFDFADVTLTSYGFTLESVTDSGSRYYRRGQRVVRVADHQVPATRERFHNAESGRVNWADRDFIDVRDDVGPQLAWLAEEAAE